MVHVVSGARVLVVALYALVCCIKSGSPSCIIYRKTVLSSKFDLKFRLIVTLSDIKQYSL